MKLGRDTENLKRERKGYTGETRTEAAAQKTRKKNVRHRCELHL
jgi:hypothetical protein